MKYLEKCIKESLRVRPPVPMMTRKVEQDIEIGNTTIPRGCSIMISAGVIHTNPTVYENPYRFDPERFSDDVVQQRHPYAFIPFSAGPRNCIGQKFAMFVEKTVLSWFFRRFSISTLIPPENNVALPEIILKPSLGFPCIISSRNAPRELDMVAVQVIFDAIAGTLLDAEILQEHLVSQPLLCAVLLFFAFLSLFTFLFSIIFVACRALGNCGAKRYQIGKRQAPEQNVLELFEDPDYNGDFEKLSSSTDMAAFVTAPPKNHSAPDIYGAVRNRKKDIHIRRLMQRTTPQPDLFVFQLGTKAIHGPFVWDTWKDVGSKSHYRHDSTSKVLKPLSLASLSDLSVSHSGDEMQSMEERANEIIFDLKEAEIKKLMDPEKFSISEPPTSTTTTTTTTTTSLSVGTADPVIEVEGQVDTMRQFTSSSQELQDLLELPSKATIELENEWWESVGGDELERVSTELLETAPTSTIAPVISTESLSKVVEHLDAIETPPENEQENSLKQLPLSESAEVELRYNRVPSKGKQRNPSVVHETAGMFPYTYDTEAKKNRFSESTGQIDAPLRSAHSLGSSWIVRLSMVFIAVVMVLLAAPIPVLITAGSICYMRSYHPMDRSSWSDKIGQLCVVLPIVILFFIPCLCIYLDVVLTYIHFFHTLCPAVLLLHQQRELSLDDPIIKNSASAWATQECQRNLAAIFGMWFSCLLFVVFSIPTVFAMLKLSKYYLRMKSEYYWNICDGYGVIRPRVATMQHVIYGNVYGTLHANGPSRKVPPRPMSTSSLYAAYGTQPIYTTFRRD
ncbi:hypothetical protein Q1695_010768 [Nippostrongylus brasiliensis]|nr:hypothetical protein Q1695_010768 [Nippostrongylus brasiliensis]